MADTFFGFNTTTPMDDDGNGGLGEDDYDALNDETFGSATNGDWEDIHENLVLLDNNGNKNSKNKHDVDDVDLADLDFNLAKVGLEDCEEVADDNESRLQLDPSVWAAPIKPAEHSFNNAIPLQNIPTPFQNQQHMPMQINIMPKILSVEDIERDIRNQQIQHNTEQVVKPGTPIHQHQQQPQPQNFPPPPLLPPGMISVPPGFSPLNIMATHHNMTSPLSHLHPNLGRPMQQSLSVALNNFAMHPNFNATQPHLQSPQFQSNHQQQQQEQQQQQQQTQNILKNAAEAMFFKWDKSNETSASSSNNNQQQQSVNQFNKRLVHEIQLNHPMLPFNRMNTNLFLNNSMGQLNVHSNMQGLNQHHQQSAGRNNNNNNNNNNNQHQQHNRNVNGNYEDDEYANLMTNRDKQWLIGIQLSQLNTGTPYIDDFYYTVFKERRARSKGIKENKAHKDNQLNHPLCQPKGHAQLVLISMSNKNGSNLQRNLQNGRERKNSETKDKDQPRTYTPLQFENSLGKLQCGSVTAPRKIIDMDCVGADTGSPLPTSLELSTQRKSRQILLHIETLFRLAIKLEDLENPTAISTALVVKERKEKERQMALEMERLNGTTIHTDNGNIKFGGLGGTSSLAITEREDTRDEMLIKLLAGLNAENVAQILTIRKGKTLIKRILPLIREDIHRWDVWCAIFSAMPALVKKDKEDSEALTIALFPQFQLQIRNAPIDAILRITNTLIACDTLDYVFTHKFSISSIIVLILKIESVYAISSNAINSKQQIQWIKFLNALTSAASTNIDPHLIVYAKFDTDIKKPLVNHFARFRELKSQPLVAVLIEKKLERELNKTQANKKISVKE